MATRLNTGRARWLGAMLLCLPMMTAWAQTALSPNGLSVTTPNGYAVVVKDDLVLRSEAGELRWGRQWDGQEWRFNPQWESLSQSWKNLTGSQAADTTGATVTAGGTGAGTSSATSGATATLSAGASGGGSGGGCWVWVDEDWQPSYGTALIGGLPQAEPVVPARLTPFNRVMGEVGAEQASYPPLQRVSVDYASLCAGAAVAMPPATDVEAIRRANELYLGDNGRYAFSNRAVLEKRTVRQIAAAAPEALSTSLASGRITLSPQTNDKGFRWIDKSGDWIDYNTQGQVVAYGDRNNNTTWLARDTGGRLLGVVDNRGRVLLTLHYTGQLLTEVKDQPVAGLVGDLPARSVKYAYDSANRLVSVTDARGNVSSYGYNVSNRIVQITDAQGRVEKLGYTGDAVSSHTAADGGVTDHVFEYDDANKQFISKITGPQTEAGRRVEDLTHNRAGKLVRQIVNGRTDAEVRYDTGARSETATNARGLSTRITRNEFDQVVAIVFPDGAQLRKSHSAIHLQQTEEVDELGVITRYVHDAVGNLLQQTDAWGLPEARVTVYTRNAQGLPTQIVRKGRTEADGSVTPDAAWTIAYDDQGQMSQTTDPEGQVRRYTHDRAGNLVAYTDPLGAQMRFEVDALGSLRKVTDPLGRVRSFELDKVGNAVAATDARLKVTRATYDGLNRRVSLVNPVGGIYKVQFNGQGLPVSETDEDGRLTQAEYDNFLRLVKQVDGLGHATTYGYNVPDGTGGTGGTAGAGMLGSLSEPTEVRYPTLTQRQRFDARERLTSDTLLHRNTLGEEGLVSSQQHDARGQVVSDTDANGKTRSYTYDALGRLTQTTDSLGAKTRAVYDARDNLVQITDAQGHVNRFAYDRNDRLVQDTLPMGQATRYGYDAAGNLSSLQDPAGRRITYRYDAAYRLQEARHFLPGDVLARTVRYTLDDGDNLTAWSDTDHLRGQTASGSATFDDAGRKTQESTTYPLPGGGTHTLGYGYAYSLAGKKTQLVWPDGTVLGYAYSDHGELQAVSIPGEGSISVNQFKWLAPTQVTLPGGTVQERTLDGLLHLEAMKVKAPNQQTVLSLSHTWGKVQELQASQRTDVIGSASSTSTRRFGYDSEQRLTQVDTDTGGLFGTETETFTLDALGNRVGHSKVSGAWRYDDNNRLLQRGTGASATAYTHDEAGNLSTQTEPGGRTTRYVHDALNRLSEVQDGSGRPIARYGYDPLDRRIWKEQFRDATGQALAQAVRTLYLYADEGLIAEATQPIALQADGSVQAMGTPAIVTQYGPRLGAEVMTGTLFVKTLASNGQPLVAYYHHDPMQTPLQATDKAGNVVWAASYNVFGEASITTPPATPERPTIASSLRLPGQMADAETGLHYNYRRYYDPQVGRYITQDPKGLTGGFNLYQYADADPVNRADPSGECPQCAAFAVCMASCALTTAAENAITGECNNWGNTAKDCAIGCAAGMGMGWAAGKAWQWAKRAWDRLPCAISSFPGETLVHVRPRGAAALDAQLGRAELRRIDQLQVGDEVLALAEWKDKGRQPGRDERLSYEKLVDVLHSHRLQGMVHLGLSGGARLTATEGHAFMTSEGWRDAGTLQVGARLHTRSANGQAVLAVVESVQTERETVPVFNLEVARAHTFFVGDEGELVHNGRCTPAMRRAWEKFYGKQWPKNPPTEKIRPGGNQDGHHIVHKSKGGSDHPSNITPMTPSQHIDHHKTHGYK